MKRSHLREVTKINAKGVFTYYLYEVWSLELPQEIFLSLTKSSKIFISESYKITRPAHLKVADHCQVLDPKFKNIISPCSAPRIRVSICGLVNLTYKNNHIYLIQDRVIKPFGGAFLFTQLPKIPTIKLDDPKSQDLRFTIKASHLPKIKPWFDAQIDRELTVHRELKEELSEENKILTAAEVEQLLAL